ncbi:hypothetical protein [Undibacterium sp. TS12]|uniref:hypothetical protein n=1 Tax=Undibacterium sp. TS12 TaxID=2908202 RepID=UPI001F4C7234|nr:hypothetical protein [Undibacterium sp. TS12]MCH8617527.1 hypothetical protein [Undibacterium sp. TS12]
MSSDVTGHVGDTSAHGCTVILRPDGNLLAQVPELQEGMLMADIYLNEPEQA